MHEVICEVNLSIYTALIVYNYLNLIVLRDAYHVDANELFH